MHNSILVIVFPDNCIYAVGGETATSSVERYDTREGKWFSLDSSLIYERIKHGATSLDGYIYCSGGGNYM